MFLSYHVKTTGPIDKGLFLKNKLGMVDLTIYIKLERVTDSLTTDSLILERKLLDLKIL